MVNSKNFFLGDNRMRTPSIIATVRGIVTTLLVTTFVSVVALAFASPAVAATDCVNALDYFIGGDKFNWKGSTGTHRLSQNFSSNLINGWMYYIKFGNPDTNEHYTWDANYIYLRQDGYPNPYTFNKGRWLKNGTICKGDSISSPNNKITTYDSNCNLSPPGQQPQPFPITVTYVDHWPTYFLGSRGYVDVILVDYQYGPSKFERFFYSKEYGWVRWELWHNGVITNSATWDSNDIVTGANTARPPKCDNY